MTVALSGIIVTGLVIWWLLRIVKKAVVSPVRIKDGLLLDARLTEKTRLQVMWENYGNPVCFFAGLIIGITIVNLL